MNLREFGNWALSEKSVANPPPNNGYKGECVSLIQQYLYKVFGIPFAARGHAKDFVTPPGFTKVYGTPQRGDIIKYGENYPGSGGFGHIALIDVNGKFFEQNGSKYHQVTYRDTIPSGYIAILRPNDQNKLGITNERKHIHLSKNVEKWRVYSLNVAPVVGNEKGFLLPSKFGGLDYNVDKWISDTVAIITTRDYGQVQIYVGPDTDSVIY